MVTAVARALYRDEPGPVILDDDLALGLAGEEGAALADHVPARSKWPPVTGRVAEVLRHERGHQASNLRIRHVTAHRSTGAPPSLGGCPALVPKNPVRG